MNLPLRISNLNPPITNDFPFRPTRTRAVNHSAVTGSLGGHADNIRFYHLLHDKVRLSLKANHSELSERHVSLIKRPTFQDSNQNLPTHLCGPHGSYHMRARAISAESPSQDLFAQTHENETEGTASYDTVDSQPHHQRYENRFLIFARLGSVLDSAAESFFKSEIRRRLCITAALLVISRIGYFIPLPGFDRRLIPENYLSFASGSLDNLGDISPELKLSLFQLGISPQIGASIVMQVLCYVLPSLVKLRKEGLDANEKIKGYIWWCSLGFAILEALILSCFSLQYSIYAADQRVKHVIWTTFLLTCGAMTMSWICDKISQAGFGQGSSLIICVNILTGYTETLYKMLSQLSGGAVSWWPYVLAVLGVFTLVTMWAVVVTQGCRKVKLQYYGFKLASSAREGSLITEVDQYIPFNINPSGMQPVLTTSYLLGFPAIMASIFDSRFWAYLKEILNPETSIGAKPWVYYSIYAFFVFLFNIFDIANMPKEIAEYLNKMGARIPNIKPGKATVEYLTKIQASTRFWGGLLLSILATTSIMLDHYLRSINEGFAIGFTSVLIIVGSIIELRRSYQAYNVMPSLSKALKRYGV